MNMSDVQSKNSYINLRIGKESFAISVYKVLEIIQYEGITHVPNCSDFVPGILNFRGSIVPVIDMHKRFNVEAIDAENQMVVVVDVINNENTVLMGLLVDQVTDVIEFEVKSIKSVPDLGVQYNPEFIEGFLEHDGKYVMVLNIDKVLSVQEITEVGQFLKE
jgi:purine-binding chemotaxis protein CheW